MSRTAAVHEGASGSVSPEKVALRLYAVLTLKKRVSSNLVETQQHGGAKYPAEQD